MYPDIVSLRAFYRSPLGITARRLIRRRILASWSPVEGEEFLGLGYATPYLSRFKAEGSNITALMPARTGALHWPESGANLAGLVDELELPLSNGSMERILMVHSLENTENYRELLREVWRVLAPGGRVLLVVPNRRSTWARSDVTPFGYGRPFSFGQLRRTLRENDFEPVSWHGALYAPPSHKKLTVKALGSLEQWGNRLWRNFCGVLIVEVEKQMHVPAVAGRRSRRAATILVPAPS